MTGTTVPANRDREAGETLIELLIAVVIIAFAASALLGMLIQAITGTSEHRGLSVDETLLKSFAETAKNEIQTRSANLSGTPLFVSCAPAGYTISNFSVPSAENGYTIAGTKLTTGSNSVPIPTSAFQYWNSSSPPGNFQAGVGNCDGKVQDDIQLITVQAVAPNGYSQSLSFVVRGPNS